MSLLDLPADATLEELATWQWRFWEKVSFEDECWTWKGARQTSGYGHFNINGRSIGSHRIAYEFFRDTIPAGLELDHLCKNRACVNPAHLEAVTPAENNARSLSLSALNARKTHCKNDHPLSDANLYVYRNARQCKTCRAATLRAMRRDRATD